MQPSDRQPPRFVPTLTEVVEPTVEPPTRLPDPAQEVPDRVPVQPVSVAEAPPTPAPVGVPAMTSDALRDQGLALAQTLQLRVMERLDGVLEERLRYALADVVQLQTQALYQSIRQEVEGLVSAAVNEAVAQELADLRYPPATRG
ncbi:hypothetical protein [Comamonas aquatica]|jgi:hypothetical protein|uniref:DUF2486 domain-containing protein n=1 Tax=Comamonas aquatica TaxID=225991 RepID=A0AA35GH43_9BURK|nr:hypothetical protein [Comamonas aquatica]CAB5651162.1 Uncharacterised protein [Comamonas aquatica]CAB5670969.1 Uncharacterised protein [Comamonas aquatica]CAC9219482.1 Uncharacterised protein [Comamonas aquatica]CAC9684285.1 Uncharacterised protein [Comamonas aquatica]